MATSDCILRPGEANGTQINDLGATTASSVQNVGKNYVFVIVAVQAVTIRFGVIDAVTDPNAASFLIPANTPMTFDTGEQFSAFKVFNTAGTTTDIHYLRLTIF